VALDTDLISYWKLDETSGDAVDALDVNTLTNINVSYESGKINNGVKVTIYGSLLITDAEQTGLDITGDISFSFWLKPSTVGEVITLCIKGKYNPSPNITYLLYMNNSGKVTASLYSNASEVESFSLVTALTANVWSHLAFTFNATSGVGKWYLDGTEDSTETWKAVTLNDNDGSFYLGCHPAWATANKIIDEFGIWDKVLSPTEVVTLYNGGTGRQYPFSNKLTMSVGVGSFILTGEDASLREKRSYSLTASKGTFTLTGVDLNILLSKVETL
jgi:hypothetical protein